MTSPCKGDLIANIITFGVYIRSGWHDIYGYVMYYHELSSTYEEFGFPEQFDRAVITFGGPVRVKGFRYGG
jgi:hypothetical protein